MRTVHIGAMLLVGCASAVAQFSPIKVSVDGEEQDPQNLVSLAPLVVDLGIFKDGSFNTFYFRETDAGFSEIYNTRDGLPGVTGDVGDHRIFAAGGKVLMLNQLTTSAGARGNSIVWQMAGNTFVNYAPDAQTALGQGADAKFYYDWAVAGASGAIYAIGYDNIFPHFLVKITEGNTEILAQESVTDYPDSSEKFSDFGNKLAISPDESMLAFFGMNPSGKSSLFIRTEEGFLTVMDSDDTVPGSEHLISQFPFFRSGIDFKFGDDNSLFVQVNEPDGPVLLRWKNGNLERFFAAGDELAGVTIQNLFLSTLLPLPDGSVLYNARPQIVQFKDGEWSLYFNGAEAMTEDGKRPGVVVNVRADGVYIPFDDSHTDPGEGNISNSILRRGFDEAEFQSFFEFPMDVFGGNFRNPHIWFSGDRVFLQAWPSIFVGTTSDLVSSPAPVPTPEPSPGLEGYAAFADALPADLKAPGQDADRDGLSNVLEYLLGLNALSPDQGTDHISVSLRSGESLGIDGDSSQYLTLAISVLASIQDASVSVSAGTSVTDLNGATPASVVGDPITEGDRTTHTFRTPFSTATDDQGFLHLSVTLNDQ